MKKGRNDDDDDDDDDDPEGLESELFGRTAPKPIDWKDDKNSIRPTPVLMIPMLESYPLCYTLLDDFVQPHKRAGQDK